MSETFVHRSTIDAPAAEVFRWHELPGALERLTPPWMRVEVLERKGGIADGGRVTLRMKTPVGTRRWVTEHRDFVRGRMFRDVQVSGPFRSFEHEHVMEAEDADTCRYEDRIEYELPGGALGRLVAGGAVRRDLERAFAYRHRTVAADLALAKDLDRPLPLRFAISGAGGLVGATLTALLTTAGHEVLRLVRREPAAHDEVRWDPAAGTIDADRLEGLDGFVHLAGENVAGGRWTPERKERIRRSRVEGTALVSRTLAALSEPPPVLVCASAIGFYGDRGEEQVDETSPAGTGFLPDTCKAWEAASLLARESGLRVVKVRLGVVLTPAGGALGKMLTPFRMGVGGVVGNGRQFMSWISIDDVCELIYRALLDETLEGPVNGVTAEPVTNREFTQTLGRVLRRPTVFPMPAFAARAAFGEMADGMLLASTHVVPRVLLDRHHDFRHPGLEGALRHVLGRTRP